MTKEPLTKEQVKAAKAAEIQKDAITHGLGHVLRRRLLAEFPGPTAKTSLSPKDMAARLEEPLTNVSYHVRMLLDLGLIELIETAQRRGALEHYYRKTKLGVEAQGVDKQIAARIAKGVK